MLTHAHPIRASTAEIVQLSERITHVLVPLTSLEGAAKYVNNFNKIYKILNMMQNMVINNLS
jgi:hypothetical protein